MLAFDAAVGWYATADEHSIIVPRRLVVAEQAHREARVHAEEQLGRADALPEIQERLDEFLAIQDPAVWAMVAGRSMLRPR